MKLNILNKFLNLPTVIPDVEFNDIQTDSRKIKPGDLYVAIVGEHLDGNDFVGSAEKNGAVAAITSKPIVTKIPTLLVPDTIKALAECAEQWRAQFNFPIIGITGSCGKTTVKDMLNAISQAAYGEDCFATKGNLNTDISVPIMLLSLQKNHRIAVIEMGMGKPGDLRLLSHLVKPSIATINNIALAHSEFLGSLDDVARNKAEIFSGLQENGVAVLNADEPYLSMWREMNANKKILTFGERGDVRLSNVTTTFEGCEFSLQLSQQTIHVKTKLPGKHTAMNAACAAACAYAAGVDVVAIQTGLESVDRPARRMQQLLGKNNSVLIDDGYNANPKATKAAIDVLKLFHGKKILVLGAMRELGESECELHAEVGNYAKKQGIHYLFAIGDIAEHAAKAFGDNGFYLEDRGELAKHVIALLDQDVCVLVKGSLSMNMKAFVDRFSFPE